MTKIFDGFFHSVFRVFASHIPSAEIGLVGFAVFGVVLGELLFFPAGEPETKPRGNLHGNFVLNQKDISELMTVLLAPDLSAVCDVDQLGAYVEGVATLNQPTGQNGADVQLASDRDGIHLAALIAEHRAASHDPQLR